MDNQSSELLEDVTKPNKEITFRDDSAKKVLRMMKWQQQRNVITNIPFQVLPMVLLAG